MAAVAVASSSPAHHYIRTFTAPSTWSRNAPTPAYTAPQHHHHYHHQQQQPLKTAGSPPGGRRRAYAFRVASPQPQIPRSGGGGTYKFDPFADEPTTPTLQTLASLSAPPPPPAPRLAPASLPGQQRKPYNHQLAQQAKRGVPPGYTAKRLPAGVEPLPLITLGAGVNNDMWKGFSPKPIPKARGGFTYEVVEYDDYDVPPPPSPSPPPPYTATSPSGTTLLNSPYTPRRSVSPPSRPSSPGLNPHSPAFTPSVTRRAVPAPAYSAPSNRPQRLTRTPSPPASPAPAPSFSSARQALQNDRDAKSRLVAGILLNRVHVPKVRRRPLVPGVKRVYVPSGLRNEVKVDA